MGDVSRMVGHMMGDVDPSKSHDGVCGSHGRSHDG